MDEYMYSGVHVYVCVWWVACVHVGSCMWCVFVRMFMWVHVCMCDYEHVILVEAGMFVLQYLEGACEYMSVFVCVFEHVSSSLMCVCLCQISCDFVQLISIPLFQCINLYVYVTVPF